MVERDGPAKRRATGQQAALFVRIPAPQARALDRAALELGIPKQRLVAGLLERYVDPDSPASLAALGSGSPAILPPSPGAATTVGHVAFRARDPEVLTPEEAAELLRVELETVLELARARDLPGRELGGHWRFSRPALLDWLAGPQDRPGR